MPYWGIVDNHGKELSAKGYHRLDASQTRFKISPPDNAINHIVFVNVDAVMFPSAEEEWKQVADLALYDEVWSDDAPLITCPLNTNNPVLPGTSIMMAPGQLRIGSNFRGPGTNQPTPQGEYEQLRHGLIQAQQDNVKLHMEATAKLSMLQSRCAKLVAALQATLQFIPVDTNLYDHVRKTLNETIGGGVK